MTSGQLDSHSGAPGSGRTPLLLLPGHCCDHAVWASVAPRLAGLVECRIPEFADEPSLAAMAERVLADAPATFALVGHSMGGRVALEVLRRAPKRIERLALLDTGCRAFPGGAAGEDERSRRLLFRALAHERGMRALGDAILARMVLPARLTDTALVDAILAMVARQTPERVDRQSEALLARPDASAAIRAYAGAVVVICGAEDHVSPVAQNAEVAALCPRAELVVIPDCGHMAPMERPVEVAAALVAWLRAFVPRGETAFARTG